ncbi:peptidoglycan-binding protein [Paenibacillus sp. ACRRX]|uniref:peptidoglycan-binding domain-containing protein n=1 Tax=unclassified Paenibacillus TaxID=185978 RepID=UPI001EF5C50B|nr:MULTISPECIES: peptidoglycan-binding domain-containing protein [unclassified Paenibacillus]MCG7408937.1 peptidoglycan-binding protein [Paenibacillus sp. ACRRX]MDK8182152.1 peptidoglycan-binding domain-containing protein [Paenibacillus sp. UMB4589-SE434]
MNKKSRLSVALAVSSVLMLSVVSSAFAAAGHNNVAAVGTAASNTKYGTSFQSTYALGQTHAQVAVLKQNLKDWRAYGSNESYFAGVAKITSTNGNFDQATKDNLKVFQTVKGLTSDGIYGAGSRNALHAAIGSSPVGYVRLKDTSHYINYNDTTAGIAADASYKLDHSWVTPATKTALDQVASSFYSTYSKKLEINDGSLIDGDDTPEHAGHRNGKNLDIRNKFGTTAMTPAQEKKFLEIAIANSSVTKIRFSNTYGLTSSKLIQDSTHADHFHLDF